MEWLVDRFKEKSTYIGLGTIAFSLAKDAIPIPFAGEIIELIAGAVLVGMREQKYRR